MKDQLIDPLHRIKPEEGVEVEDDGDLLMGESSAPNGGVKLPDGGWGNDNGVEVWEVEMKSLLDD